jgi:hypothetical protein
VFGLGYVEGAEKEENGRTHDITHEEEDAEVVGLAQTLDALVDVLGVETMVSQAATRRSKSVIARRRGRRRRWRDLRKMTPVVLPT